MKRKQGLVTTLNYRLRMQCCKTPAVQHLTCSQASHGRLVGDYSGQCKFAACFETIKYIIVIIIIIIFVYL